MSMSFKPQKAANQSEGSSIDWNAINVAVKGGSRPCRLSLIIDMGTQEREDFVEAYNPNSEKHTSAIEQGTATRGMVMDNQLRKEVDSFIKPQKPVQQLVMFGDLTSDVVNYGETLGNQPYRIMMNSQFDGKIKGTTFGAVPPSTKGGIWTFHGNSIFTKLANATDNQQILDGSDANNMDVSQLLGSAFMATIVKKQSPDGTKTYVNFKGVSAAPEMPDGSAYPIPELVNPPQCITFDNVTAESAKFINRNVKAQIRLAKNFAGSQMEAVIGAEESAQGTAPPAAAPKAQAASKPADVQVAADPFDDDVPF